MSTDISSVCDPDGTGHVPSASVDGKTSAYLDKVPATKLSSEVHLKDMLWTSSDPSEAETDGKMCTAMPMLTKGPFLANRHTGSLADKDKVPVTSSEPCILVATVMATVAVTTTVSSSTSTCTST